jgi:TonB-linked SusC/RagA family outer membrane protein
MNLKRLLTAIVVLLVAYATPVLAQDKQVTGKVTDSKDGSPLAGATVKAKGTTVMAQSGNDGMFKLKVPAATKSLVVSYVGFADKEVAIVGETVNVSLQAANGNLTEMVVVAYGTRRKSDLTGAVTSVSAKDFQKGNIASPEQLLQGKVAGLQITTGGGSAGGGSRIRIRGGASLNASNEPLIVIDGVPVDGNGISGSANLLSTINPNDIESMSVLKDAAATALYGSRASNGVIIVTTKKGTSGKVKFNFNTQQSVGVVGKKVDVLSGDEIRSIVTADAAATGNNSYKNLLGNANTNWQNEIYRAAIASDNNISASGTYMKIPFRISLGYLSQDGILKTDHFGRVSTALNLSPKFFNDHLSVNVNAKYSGTKKRFANEGAVGSAAAFDPTQPIYVKYGAYYEWLQSDGNPINLATRNPLGLLNLRNNNSAVNRLIGNIQLDYKLNFLPDLHIQANVGIDNASGSGDDNTDSISATNILTAGRFVHYEQKKKNTLVDFGLFYTKDLKSINSKLDVLLSHSYQSFVTDVKNFAAFGQNGVLIPGTTPAFLTDKPEYRLESYLGRVNYTYANKYLLTASLRSDASSKFSKDNRVGYFPAVVGAWKINEDFFKGSKSINELKLRIGWGITGQQDGIDYYSYLARYSNSTPTAQYQFGSTFYSFLRPSAFDPNIKWETTTTTNFGLDFALFNNRVSGNIEVYNKKTKDLLSVVPVAPGANFNIELLTNVGNIENKGVEFNINTTPIKTKNLTWDFGFNITYNKSEITNLLKQSDANFKGIDVSGISGGTGNRIGKFAVGYAPYVYNVYKQVYDKFSGKPIEGLYEDLNRDGQIDDADRYYYAKPAPTILFGLSTQVAYKQWTVGITAHGSGDNYLYNNYASNSGVLRAIKNPIIFVGNASRSYLETRFNNNQYLSDYYIENASFFRLDNINIGYNAGKVFKNKSTLRINASIQNVFLITNYKGLDPEVASDSGVDNNIYPRPRIFSLGFNFDF